MIRSIEEQRRAIAPETTLGAQVRIASPEDVANLVLFLLSDLAANITGAHYVTDGGRMVLPGPGLLRPANRAG